jgi:hypothetical protein
MNPGYGTITYGTSSESVRTPDILTIWSNGLSIGTNKLNNVF